MLNKYDTKNIRLMFTDTDSLLYEIKTKDIYKDLYEKDRKYFDTSDNPTNSDYHSTENKNVIGKMKDEAAGVPINEFVGLRSKIYSYCLDHKYIKIMQRCHERCFKISVTYDDYKNTLFNSSQMEHTTKTIGSNNHKIKSYEITKNSLSCFDNK